MHYVSKNSIDCDQFLDTTHGAYIKVLKTQELITEQ
jgi:hypothetical protein